MLTEIDVQTNAICVVCGLLEYAEEEYQNISGEIEDIDDRLANLEKKYAKSGGISKKDWHAMQDQIAKEEAKRDEIRKWLKDIANNVLPFIIMRR